MTIKSNKEILENNPTLRLDAEFFRKEYLALYKTLFAKPCMKLENVVSWITQGPNPVFVEDGIPCLTGRNISNGRVNYDDSDYLSEEEYQNHKRFQLIKGDTLITLKGLGSIGKIGFVTESRKAIFSRDIGIIRPKDINPGYVNAFILSNYGSKIINRGETGGTGQRTLATSYLKNIDIPRLTIEDTIGNLVNESENILKKSEYSYSQAETILVQSLGLQDFKPSTEAVNIKTFKESFGANGRLDAEYYQVKYEQIKNRLEEFKTGTVHLGDVCKTFRGNFVSEDFYDINGITNYIRGADISSNQIVKGRMIKLSNNFSPSKELLTKQGDIIIALIGSVGTAALVNSEFANSIISNNLGLIRIYSNKILPEYLHLFLTNKKLGYLLFNQKEMRTAQPKLSDKDILDFPIPLLNLEQQQQLCTLVEESIRLKKQSEQLLEAAKKAVEMAIEEGEEGAMEWVEEQV